MHMFKSVISFILFSSVTVLNASEQEVALNIIKDKCQHCHGLYGEASNVIYPRLAGQNKDYINKQLLDFRSGKRVGTMNDMAAGLTDEQITALANYFSTQPTKSHRIRDKAFSAVGSYIYHHGNEYADIPACASCHGEKAEGNESLPRLAGQHKRYVSGQLIEFNARKRTNDNAIMHSIASKMTEFEIEAVALYVSGLE